MLGTVLQMLRGAMMVAAVAAAGMMMTATPATAGEGDCATVEAGSPDGPVDCAYCEIDDSQQCVGLCEDGTVLEFPCTEFD